MKGVPNLVAFLLKRSLQKRNKKKEHKAQRKSLINTTAKKPT